MTTSSLQHNMFLFFAVTNIIFLKTIVLVLAVKEKTKLRFYEVYEFVL